MLTVTKTASELRTRFWEVMSRRKISVSSFARSAGVSERGISKAMGPNGNPTIDTAAKIESALDEIESDADADQPTQVEAKQ